ncbi:MAG: hypothetical protein Hyperionvirus4_127 [Hyperionvirus sp.]|uniref:Uncharacterized protein n=1 Tax=Hyperionvirus sp. TaxID=2487770 RepID=A0A3G5A7Z3_9VIRU|nr:MAG: hypothetical protein Hyperionvirus4_127 [Hyperionvirus sp.]
MAAAGAVSPDKSPIQYTVWWNARGKMIEVERESALRSDRYRAFETYRLSKEQKFYINWSEEEVHKLLDLVRDSALIRVDLSIKPTSLIAYLMIDVASCQKKDDDDKKRIIAEDEKKNVSLLLSIAAEIKKNPDQYSCRGHRLTYKFVCNCAILIPETYCVDTLYRFSKDVPLVPDKGDVYRWEWKKVTYPQGIWIGFDDHVYGREWKPVKKPPTLYMVRVEIPPRSYKKLLKI